MQAGNPARACVGQTQPRLLPVPHQHFQDTVFALEQEIARVAQCVYHHFAGAGHFFETELALDLSEEDFYFPTHRIGLGDIFGTQPLSGADCSNWLGEIMLDNTRRISIEWFRSI